MRNHPARVLGSVVTALATAVVLLALSILPFLNPAWVGFEQDRSDAAGWTGYGPSELRTATNAILFDLVVGPPEFDIAVDGRPVLDEAERGHMRDVRSVFAGFTVLALLAGLWLVVARRLLGRRTFWAIVRRAAVGLVIALGGAALVAVVAFDAAFEVFHRLLFSGGNWAFDPATSRLVQLFPMQFWYETSIGVGAIAILLAGVAFTLAGTRDRRVRRDRIGVEPAVRVPR